MNLANWNKTVMLHKEHILSSCRDFCKVAVDDCTYWFDYDLNGILHVDINMIRKDGIDTILVYRIIDNETDPTTWIKLQ
jgi:hypothetical protein